MQAEIRKVELLPILEENREQHRVLFEEALEAWQKKMIEWLEQRKQEALRGERIPQVIQLERPEDHTSDYNRVIRLLQLDIEDTVKLSEGEVKQYVMDDWSWKQQFNQSYSSSTGKSLQ